MGACHVMPRLKLVSAIFCLLPLTGCDEAPPPPRYQAFQIGSCTIVRLDRQTGDIDAFVVTGDARLLNAGEFENMKKPVAVLEKCQ